MELEEIKNFLKVDFDDDNKLILELKSAAIEYLENAGIIQNEKSNLYKLALKILINHWYTNRNIAMVGTITNEVEFSLQRIMAQLKLGGDDF